MKQKGIWLRNGWRLHHLNAAELALALVREKPLTAQQLCGVDERNPAGS